MSNNNVTVVKFVESQRGHCEDVYKCGNRFYIRKEVHNAYPNLVWWGSGTPHDEGVEADSPIKSGWVMRVVNNDNNIVYEETVYEHVYWGKGIADKQHPFSWDM